MRTKLACLIAPLAVLLAACGGDDGSADTTAADTTASTDPTGTTAPTTDPTTDTTPTTDPTDATGTTDPTDATTTVDPSTGPDPDTGSSGTDPDTGTDSTGGGDICAPEADDTDCNACIKAECCAELQGCEAADPACACVLECLSTIENPLPADAMACSTECSADFATVIGPLLEVQACRDGGACPECAPA